MKKYILTSLFLFIVLNCFAQISTDKSYVLYSVYKKPVQVTSETGNEEKLQSVHYLDGRGKIAQEVAIKAGSGNEDIVLNYQYDPLGREKRQYLSYPKANSNGAYLADYHTLVSAYYYSPQYDNTYNPFTEIVYDDLRLKTPKEIAHPGNEWDLLNGHTQKYTKTTNGTGDNIRMYHVEYNENNYPVLLFDGTHPDNKLYKEIVKNENWVSANGNNNTTQTFTDFLGRKILQRNFNAGQPIDTYYVYDENDNLVFIIPPALTHDQLFDGDYVSPYKYKYQNLTRQTNLATGDAQDYINTIGTGYVTIKILNDLLTVTFNATFPATQIRFNHQTTGINSNPPLPTMYLGDLDCGPGLSNLAKVTITNDGLQLEQNYSYSSVTSFNETFYKQLNGQVANQELVDKFIYQYKYDHKNRVIEKKLPGIGWEYIVYDKQDRELLTQNAVQREAATWSFTTYDSQGRTAYSGTLYDDYPSLSQADMQDHINENPSFVTRTTTPTNISGANVYYTVNTSKTLFVRDVSYYDDYNFDVDGISLANTTTYGDDLTTSAKGLLTGFKSIPGDAVTFSTTINRYDKKDRLVHSTSKNSLLNTLDITESKIDFIGNVLEQKSIHTKTGVITNLITYDYFSYDNANRLLRHTRKTGSSPTELISFNKYNELGDLKNKKVGRSNTLASLTGLSLSNGVYTKTTAVSWTNSSLATTTALVGDGSLSLLIGNSATNQLTIGLSYTPSTTLYNQINYGINFTPTVHASGGKTAIIQENGVTKYTTNYFPNDEFIIERIGTQIVYKKNGAQLYQSLTASTTQNLYGDGHFYATGNNISDLQINNYVFENAVALQNITYKFNVRGMLTKINEVTSGQPGTGLFNMQIKYTDASAGTPYYNGNVSQIQWRTTNDVSTNIRSYNFAYDHLHRMTSASYKHSASPFVTGQYNEEVTYGDLGTISKLKRYGNNASSATVIDDLTYIYNGNQLLGVKDASNNIEGFNNTIDQNTEFTYDISGNLKTDIHKGITNILYNDMNLPTRIIFTGTNRRIDFVYDSEGNKLSKTVTNGSNVTLTEYAGDYVYVKLGANPSQLQYIQHPEGYIAYNSGNFSYVYQYTDHLGNIRLNYTDSDKNGVAEIIEENNYYPFGLKHKGYNNIVNTGLGSPYNKLGFQGQEMNDDLGLNWNSFKWRNYDPALGRFFNIDPLAEKYSFMTPYQFSSNQPVHAPELEGMESMYPIGDDLDFSGDWNAFGEDVLDENQENQVVVPQYELADLAIEGSSQKGDFLASIDREEIEEALSYAPVIGGAVDMYRGARDGNWVQFALGTVSLGLDVFTLGGASAVKGVAMIGIKQGAKAIAKEAAKEVIEEGAEAVVKEVAQETIEFNIKHTVGAAKRGSIDKGSLDGTKKALAEAKRKLGLKPGESLPKGKGKFGSPQRGTSKKGYRLDPAHPNAKPGSGEEFPHINYWDFSNGKRGSGGVSGAIPIKH